MKRRDSWIARARGALWIARARRALRERRPVPMPPRFLRRRFEALLAVELRAFDACARDLILANLAEWYASARGEKR